MDDEAEPLPAEPALTTTEVAIPGVGPQLLVPPMRLRVIEGQAPGASFTAGSDRIVLGTAPGVDVFLSDPTVSRFHCEISSAGGRATIRDLGSRNGTFVDGVAVLHAFVRQGSVVG